MPGSQDPSQPNASTDRSLLSMNAATASVQLTGTHSIAMPDSLVAPFLERGERRAVVVASFEGKEVRFHAALQKRKGIYWIMFSKKHQKVLGLFPNDVFEIRLEKDTSEFGAPMPPELEEVLRQDPEAEALFKGLTPGACRSVIYAVSRYKSSQRRIELAFTICERMKAGIRSSRELVMGPKNE